MKPEVQREATGPRPFVTGNMEGTMVTWALSEIMSKADGLAPPSALETPGDYVRGVSDPFWRHYRCELQDKLLVGWVQRSSARGHPHSGGNVRVTGGRIVPSPK